MTPEDIERLIKNLGLPTALVSQVQRDLRVSFDFGIENVEKILNRNILDINPAIREYLEKYTFDLVKGMNEDLGNKLRDTLRRGIMNGQNSKVIAKEVKEIFQSTKHRAEMIARTETSRAYNYGAYSAAKSSGVELVKYYSAVHDDRTCPICKRLSNKYSKDNPIPIDKEFIDEVSGLRGLYPPLHPNSRSESIFIPKKNKVI